MPPTIFAANLDHACRHEKLRPTFETELYKVCYIDQSHGGEPTIGKITRQDQGFNIYREPCSDATLSDFANLTSDDDLARIRLRLRTSVHISSIAAQSCRARYRIRPYNCGSEVRPARSTACCPLLHSGSAVGSTQRANPMTALTRLYTSVSTQCPSGWAEQPILGVVLRWNSVLPCEALRCLFTARALSR
jgi:hypothetical protein